MNPGGNHMRYELEGVCARAVSFDLDGKVVRNVRFVGGCPGNLLAIGKIVEGMEADIVIERFKNNRCQDKGTSCVDQFAKVLEKARG